ncbi:hypothetical protein JX266_001343 [Neoarthrinium moseri]|nr:hypothetical protein JX266_001343 [Neoarthrinium moseri]
MSTALSDKDSGFGNQGIYWPRDLLPGYVPSARILTYGYDTRIKHWLGGPKIKTTIYDISHDFLVSLEAYRRESDGEDPLRPIVFIAHSLGGIVVKELLRQSKAFEGQQMHLHDVYQSTQGIVFFGTPHGGADPRGFVHHVVEKVLKCMGFSANAKIVESLLPTSERLKELRDEFGSMARLQKWSIHCFQEQLGVAALGGHKVVEDVSSCLNDSSIETTEHIVRNHMDMCRFSRGGIIGDPEFLKVARAIERIVAPIVSQDRLRYMEGCRGILLKSLEFPRMDSRYFSIEDPETRTCRWLLETPEYRSWRDPSMLEDHHGFLWIRGKPGAGKSTLAKFAADQANKEGGRMIARFFFNARGNDLEKSTAGMYRSLLLQIMVAEPKLMTALDILVPKYDRTARAPSDFAIYWNIQTLKTIFERAILRLNGRRLECFIDALDECDEDQIRDMVHFLEDIGHGTRPRPIFYAWFTSRHYPHISLRHGLSFTLEHQGGHSQDIATYLQHRLRLGHSTLDEDIRSQILHKASGVFMWVVLVVSILNTEYDRGRIHALQRRLSQLPENLHTLFRDILSRDKCNQDELLLCMQWTLFSSRPLTPTEIYFAILAGVEPGLSFEWFWGDLNEQIIERFISDCSKGLVEITGQPGHRVVQFIHESVRTFFLNGNGFREAGLNQGENFEGYSHEQLKRCCEQYVQSDGIPMDQRSRRHTFLRYSVENILYHSNEAQRCGVSQREFLSRFRYGNGACSCIFGPAEPIPNLDHFISGVEWPAPFNGLWQRENQIEGFTPLTAAVQQQRTDSLAVLLDSVRVDVNQRDALGRIALREAARMGYVAAVNLLLAQGASDAPSTSPTNSSRMVTLQ